ncbi:MAG: molybdopterin-dependent oxidoreductase, partial [Campylobacterota bacterium]|nr:molybdopterin-dependent oxidoreductase [Campylobacterota bacterium]
MKFTACPMDCLDACSVIYDNGKCRPSDGIITQGKLCKLFGYLQSEKTLSDPNLKNTLEKAANKLKEPNQKILYYKGLGNLGEMQAIPTQFFQKIGATFTHSGMLCDEAGDSGLKMGRGYNVNPPLKTLLNSEVVIVWGQNITDTSTHIYRLIKDKIFITIDPVKTKIASKSKVFLQIKPKGDYLLAQMMQSFLENKSIDTSNYSKLNISKEDFEKMMKLISNKRISVMLGVGPQKYKEGAQIFHEIDKVCYKLGLLDGENKGVWYIDTKAYGFNTKIFNNKINTIPCASVKFDEFDIVFIQGANPVVTSVNTQKIVKQLQNSFVIFMGTTLNDTSKYADIIIPAKTFLEKNDVRLACSHDEVSYCEVCEENDNAISEYELTKYLFEFFNFDGLLSEEEYLKSYKKQRASKPTFTFKSHDTNFVEMHQLNKDEYYLLTSKSSNTLNSQYKYDSYAYIHPSSGLNEEQEITIKSSVISIDI